METTRRCKLISSNGFLRVEGFWNVPRGDLEVLGRAMGKKGCLKVGSKESFFPRYFETFLSRNMFIRIFECIIISIIDWRIIIWQLTFRLISFHKNNPLSSRKITRMQHGHLHKLFDEGNNNRQKLVREGRYTSLTNEEDRLHSNLSRNEYNMTNVDFEKKKRIKFKKKKKPRQLHAPTQFIPTETRTVYPPDFSPTEEDPSTSLTPPDLIYSGMNSQNWNVPFLPRTLRNELNSSFPSSPLLPPTTPFVQESSGRKICTYA